jgi:hypothetical protein
MVIVGDCITPLSIMDRKTRQKVARKTEDLTTQQTSSNIQTLYPTTEFTFFSSARGKYSRTDHIY